VAACSHGEATPTAPVDWRAEASRICTQADRALAKLPRPRRAAAVAGYATAAADIQSGALASLHALKPQARDTEEWKRYLQRIERFVADTRQIAAAARAGDLAGAARIAFGAQQNVAAADETAKRLGLRACAPSS
jgi:hypothetical protein